MVRKSIIKENAYYDSVTLMLISSKISGMDGVENAAVMMGTDQNKDLMYGSGLIDDQDLAKIDSNHMVIGVLAQSEEIASAVVDEVMTSLEQKKTASGSGDIRTRTSKSASERVGGANMTIISVPGRYAKHEAMRALDLGMNILLFSDNVSLEEEIELKEAAKSKGLLMMGPDCGTAIINGVSLGFANRVSRGRIGVVAAAGTGLQEVSVVIDANGAGISQALGTGGRDLKAEVGGTMMLMGIEALIEDDGTDVIVIVSKPAAPEVMDKIASKLAETDKPKVLCILGGQMESNPDSGMYYAKTLEEAGVMAAALSKGETVGLTDLEELSEDVQALIEAEVSKLSDEQRYLRGLYAGGTLTYETMLIVKAFIGETYSNIPLNKEMALEDIMGSREHTVVDMGDDDFTNGRPHPMIDTRLRVERIVKEASDTEVAVILLDCVIGYGANEDPAGDLARAVVKARQEAEAQGRYISYVASVCGTESDIQVRSDQEQKLRDAGIIVMENNAQAARVAARIASRDQAHRA